jgi:hypothetical protein
MSLKDDAARVAVLSALAAQISDELDAAKKSFEQARAKEGIKSIAAVLPSGESVATITWVPQDPKAVVTDPAAFLEWVKANRPEHIERRFVSEVRPSFAKALLDEMTAGQSPVWCDKETGEVVQVPGVTLQPRAGYQRTTWAKAGEGGKAAVAAAWRAGALGHVGPLALASAEEPAA